MAVKTYGEKDVKDNYPKVYTTIGGQVGELGEVITKLTTVKDKWDEVVSSNEPFYKEFINDIDDLIKHLNGYKGYMETKGKDLKKYAKWAD